MFGLDLLNTVHYTEARGLMGTAERRAREKDDLRRKIIQAATELFLQQGYESVSMRKIADRIEYAPSTIYLYFKDKTDLLTSICRDTFQELDERLDEIADRGLPPLEHLRRALRAYVDFGLAHPSHYVFVFCTPIGVCGDVDENATRQMHTAGMASFGKLLDGLSMCMDEGVIARSEVALTGQSVWLMMHGLTSGLIVDCGFPFVDQDRLINSTLDRIVSSLLPPGVTLPPLEQQAPAVVL
jgi:AcrR family transcriptional regulator